MSLSREDAIERARKLLSLTGSPNRHEAAIAAEKARLLMERYNLSQFEIDRFQNEEVVDRQSFSSLRLPVWMRYLCSVVARHFDCRLVIDSRNTSAGNVLRIIGLRADAELAEYAFHFLRNTINTIALRLDTTGEKEVRSYKNNFRKGCVTGIAHTFRSLKEASEKRHASSGHAETMNALVVVRNKKVDDFIGSAYGRLTKTRNVTYTTKTSAYARGVAAGKMIRIDTAIRHKGMKKEIQG